MGECGFISKAVGNGKDVLFPVGEEVLHPKLGRVVQVELGLDLEGLDMGFNNRAWNQGVVSGHPQILSL